MASVYVKRLFWSLILWLALHPCSPSLITYASETEARILDYGIYEAAKMFCADAPGVIEGKIDAVIPVVKNIREADVIRAQMGILFGVRCLIVTSDDPIELKYVITSPPLKKDSSSEPISSQEFERKRNAANGSVIDFVGVQFKHDYELVPGEWTFMVYSKNKLLITKKFSVVKDQPKVQLNTEQK